MKKTAFVVVLMLLVLAASSIGFAQEPAEMKEQMVVKEMKGGMMGMQPGLSIMKKMMGGQMVATKDGGVIVLIGKKLLKYDKDLNLQKEAEIKVDLEEMHETEMQWKEKCKMDEKLTEEGGTDSTATEEMSE